MLFIVLSCKNSKIETLKSNRNNDSILNDKANIVIPNKDVTIKDETFLSNKSNAVLLGDKIELFDENRKLIKDITYLNETIVKVLAKSTMLNYNSETKNCNEYFWVKIIAGKDIGYVDGNKLYQPYEHEQNQKISFDSNEISITLTKTMGQREFDDNGEPLYCFSDKPIIFKDNDANYEGVLTTVKNKYSDKNNYYFGIFEDDSAGDKITKIEKSENRYILSILRVNQEGGANIKVAIFKNEENKFLAEIIEYINIDEEELLKQLKNDF